MAAGRVFMGGKSVGDAGDALLRNRQQPAEAGMVIVALCLMLLSQLSEHAIAQDAVTGPRIHVMQPPGGDIQAVEFRDVAGATARRIEASFQLTREEGLGKIVEVKIQAVSRYVLVLESAHRETELTTRRKTGKVWEIDNTITLYGENGSVVFQKSRLECFPVALSESGHFACLLSPPEYWEGPPAPTAVYPPHDRLLVFSRQGTILKDIEEPRWHVRNVELSPSGNWLAYIKGRMDLQTEQVKLVNLDTGKLVTIPVGKDRSVTSYQEVLDTGDLRDYERISATQPDGQLTIESRPKTLYRMER